MKGRKFNLYPILSDVSHILIESVTSILPPQQPVKEKGERREEMRKSERKGTMRNEREGTRCTRRNEREGTQ